MLAAPLAECCLAEMMRVAMEGRVCKMPNSTRYVRRRSWSRWVPAKMAAPLRQCASVDHRAVVAVCRPPPEMPAIVDGSGSSADSADVP